MLALEGFLAGVRAQVGLEVTLLGVGGFAVRADEGPLARVPPHVDDEHALVDEGGVAVLAHVGPLPCRQAISRWFIFTSVHTKVIDR